MHIDLLRRYAEVESRMVARPLLLFLFLFTDQLGLEFVSAGHYRF